MIVRCLVIALGIALVIAWVFALVSAW